MEDLAVEQLVAQLAIEGFIVPAFPEAAALDKQRAHANPSQPGAHDLGCELAAVVRSDEVRRDMLDEQVGQGLRLPPWYLQDAVRPAGLTMVRSAALPRPNALDGEEVRGMTTATLLALQRGRICEAPIRRVTRSWPTVVVARSTLSVPRPNTPPGTMPCGVLTAVSTPPMRREPNRRSLTSILRRQTRARRYDARCRQQDLRPEEDKA
jgi:hypothetical protein